MGDRGNINVDGVWLYSHWGGTELARVLQEALAKRWRWTDGSYLCRIIFDRMTEGEHGKETGFGISTEIADNEHHILHVDSRKGTVTQKTEKGNELGSWTFEEFLKVELTEHGQIAATADAED